MDTDIEEIQKKYPDVGNYLQYLKNQLENANNNMY